MREVYTPNAEKAMRETPEAAGWYDMSQVRDAMSNLSPEGADDFRKFMLFMGPTSIGTKVPDNLRQASKFFQLYKNGELDLDALKNGTLDLPKGYANRRQASVNAGIAKIMQNGNLDPFTTPKTFRYANQLAGDMWGGAALDMHVGRQVGRKGLMPSAGGELVPDTGFPTPSYSKENPIVSSSPSDTQYAHIEDALVRQASNLGLTPSQYQALGWVGGGAADRRLGYPAAAVDLQPEATRHGREVRLQLPARRLHRLRPGQDAVVGDARRGRFRRWAARRKRPAALAAATASKRSPLPTST
jgi:hypothetical protein